MNTICIKVKGSFKKTQIILQGGAVFKNDYYNHIITKYISYIREFDTEESIKQNLHYIVSFIDYLEDSKIFNLTNINSYLVQKYIYDYDCLNYSYTYSDRNKMNIRLFFNWLYENNLSSISGRMILPKIVWRNRNNIRDTYSKEEVSKLLNSINIKTNEGKELYLILSIICYLGLRISDVVNLKLSDIDFNSQMIYITQEKTNQLLILPLIDNIRYPLIDYLKNVRANIRDVDYIFITYDKPYRQNISIKNHGYKIKKAMINAGIEIGNRSAGYHVLRHSLASFLLEKNIPLYDISNILGHQHINTTMSYLNIDYSKLKDFALEVPDVK